MKPRCGCSGNPAMYSSGLSLPKWSSIRNGSRLRSAGVPMLRWTVTPAPSVTSKAGTRWRMVRWVMAGSFLYRWAEHAAASCRNTLRPVAFEHFTDARCRLLAGGVAAQHAAVGRNHLDVGDAKEAEHKLQPGGGEIDRAAHLGAAGRRQNIDLLACQKSLRALLSVAEGHAGTGDLVDPGLEAGRHTKIVDGGGDHPDVSCLHRLHQGIGASQLLALRLAACVRVGKVGGDPFRVDEGQPMRHVAPGHRQAGHARSQTFDQLVGELAGDRAIDAGAGVDAQHVQRGLDGTGLACLHDISPVNAAPGWRGGCHYCFLLLME